MRNIQQYCALRQALLLKEPTDDRILLLELAERLEYTIDRINKYNNLPFFKRLFADI